ncbi:Hypp4694 [Branchiostoma lanceolatum]|uniref:Hypp4694 protein n=1 Tax=Branchiostoma lanceolatum TaxID=7740 RepID=A0A8K0ACW7_BRALA|nr:Hypp4694 [Branchiostoma lanceolatum]
MGKVLTKRGVIVVDDEGEGPAPGVLGMNVLQEFGDQMFKIDVKDNEQGVDQAWSDTIKVIRKQESFARTDGRIGLARASGKDKIRVPAGHEMILFCRARPGPDGRPYSVLVEAPETGCLPNEILVARAYAEVRHGRVPVRITNVADYDVDIGHNAVLGELYQAEVQPQGTVEFQEVSQNEVRVDFRSCNANSEETDSKPKPKVDLSGADLTEEQKEKLEKFLDEHADVFATHKHDFGCTDAVTHKIPTGDSPPHQGALQTNSSCSVPGSQATC